MLSLSLDYYETLRTVAKLAVPEHADWCAVDLLNEDGAVERVAVEHPDPAKVQFVHEIQSRYPPDPNAPHGVYQVMRTGQAEFMAEIPEELLVNAAVDDEHLRLIRELGLRSYMAAPLSARGRVLGVITFVYAESGRSYAEDDLTLLMDLAGRAAIAIDNARLVRDLEISRENLEQQATELEAVGLELEQQVEEAQAANSALEESQEQLIGTHAELVRAEQRLEIAQDAGGVGTFDWNIVTGEVAWTVQEERLFGLAPGRFGGHIDNWSGRVHADDLAILLADFERCWEERRADTTFEFRIHREDGATRWLAGGGRFFYDADGRPLRMVGVNVDITERKLATERVASLQRVTAALADAVTQDRVAEIALEQAADILGAASGALYRLNEIDATLELVRARGMRPEVIERFARYSVHAPLPVADAVRARRGIYIGSDARRGELYPDLKREYPNPQHRAWAMIPLVVESRSVGGLALNFDTECTFNANERTYIEAIALQCAQALERVRLFEAERHARQRAEILDDASAVLASSLDVLSTLDALATVVVPRVADWCFVEFPRPDGSIEHTVVQHTDPERVRWVRELLARFPVDPNAPHGTGHVLRTGNPEIVPEIPEGFFDALTEEPDVRAAYRTIAFRSYISVPMAVRARVIGVLSLAMAESGRHFTHADLPFIEDLAARAALAVDNARLYQAAQHARVAAEEANRAKSAFLAVMSHELRTPLNAIVGYRDLLDSEVAGPITDQQRAHLARIDAGARQLITLIDQVLSFSRIEAGKEKVAHESTDLTSLVRETAALLEPTARKKGLDVVVALPDAPVMLDTDTSKVRQILLNLLSNAVKFTERGNVGMNLTALDSAVVVRVSDTGIGIDPADLKRIFEPFEQVDNSATRQQGGTGLGLPVSRELALLLGGDISVESVPGRGSVFSLVLPRNR